MTSTHEVDQTHVDFRRERRDYDVLARYIATETPLGKAWIRRAWLTRAASHLFVFLAAAPWAYRLPAGAYWTILLFFSLLLLLPKPAKFAKRLQRQLQTTLRPPVQDLEEYYLEVDLLPEGLQVRGPWKTAFYAWNAVMEVGHGDDHIFVHLADRMHLHLPLRAFHGTPHFNAFYDNIADHVRNRPSVNSDSA